MRIIAVWIRVKDTYNNMSQSVLFNIKDTKQIAVLIGQWMVMRVGTLFQKSLPST